MALDTPSIGGVSLGEKLQLQQFVIKDRGSKVIVDSCLQKRQNTGKMQEWNMRTSNELYILL